MIIKEVQDFYEIDVRGLQEGYHVIYEKVNQMEAVFNQKSELVSEVDKGTYEEISVFVESGSLIKKASYRIGHDVNNVAEALGIISHLYVNKLTA